MNLDILPFSIDKTLYEPKYKLESTIHIAGLGDVGGTLVSGLRLTGGGIVKTIGLFDLDDNKVKRWQMEAGQIYATHKAPYPKVVSLKKDELFNCDIFAFCVTAGVPPMDFQGDVRMYQFEKNSRILSEYIKQAIDANFRGLFAVISDPVDHLCLSALKTAQTYASTKNIDFSPLQIRGYGLGVMFARALFYSDELNELERTSAFDVNGRAFGPHGEDLIIADSLDEYDPKRSEYLTEKARTANLRVRETGFKPYIAPAFSSACLSLLATITGDWHYSAIYLNGAYFGIRNRTTGDGTEFENNPMSKDLAMKILAVHHRLKNFLSHGEFPDSKKGVVI